MCYSQSLTVIFLVNEDTQIVCVDNVDGHLVFYRVKTMKHQIFYCFLTTSHLVTDVSIIDFFFFCGYMNIKHAYQQHTLIHSITYLQIWEKNYVTFLKKK